MSERFPNDPCDPNRSVLSDSGFADPTTGHDHVRLDPDLPDTEASSSKVALFAVAIALVLGGVFYGLNNTSVKDAQTAPPTQTAQTQTTAPAPQGAPSGVRDSAKMNSEPGMTTGAATNRPTPPQSSPQGAEIDRSGNPPASHDSK